MTAEALPTLLLIEDNQLTSRSVQRLAERHGFRVLTAGDAEEGLRILDDEGEDVDVVLVDQGLPRMLGTEFIGVAREEHPAVDYILFTGDGDVRVGFEAQKLGASDYFTKPITDPGRFAQVLRRGVEAKRLRCENLSLRRQVETSPADRILLGNSTVMRRLRELVRRFATIEAPILITGESGVGKEMVARAISAETGGSVPYIPVNCAEFNQSQVVLSTLFGHERGAFTGAIHQHKGYFEVAGEGIVFLDEIGELDPEVQAKLLRVLENQPFKRVGGTRNIPFNGRIIAATNRNLREMVKGGRFREDLLFRLNTLEIIVPPLREHREDIPLLAYYFAKAMAEKHDKHLHDIHPDAMQAMLAYDWPGNVRELRNAVDRMVVWADDGVLGPAGLGHEIVGEGHLRPTAVASEAPSRSARIAGSTPPRPLDTQTISMTPARLRFPEHLLGGDLVSSRRAVAAAFTRWYLARKLQMVEGNKTRAAEASGQARPNFSRSLKNHAITWPLPEGLLGPDGQLGED